MPETAVAIATIFSSSTSSWWPSAPRSAAAWARCASVVSGVAYQTVIPLPRRAGVLGMLRTTWSWPRMPTRAAVVAPASTLRTSWPRCRCGPISRPTLAEHLGLDPEQDDVGAVDGLDVGGDGPDAVLALEVLAALLARMAGDDLAGLDQLAAEHAGDHRLGHDAGADGRDRGLRQGGHRAEYSRGRRGRSGGRWRRAAG